MTMLRYLTRMFLMRFLAVLIALTALVELLAMLDSLRHLVGSSSSLENVLTFTGLQLPIAMEQLFLLSVLIGGVLTFRALVSANEMTVLRSCGMSPYRLVLYLLPLTVVFSLAYYGIVNNFAPRAERAYTEWWHWVIRAQDDDGLKAPKVIWLRSGPEIISVDGVSENGRHLTGLTRYQRDHHGVLTERISAKTADATATGWLMKNTVRVKVREDGVHRKDFPTQMWLGGPAPKNFIELALPTERIQASEGRKILAGAWSGAAGTAHYRTLVQKSYVAIFLPFLMLLLAMPALQEGGRRLPIKGMATGIGLGLLFLVLNGILTSMSEASVLSPVLAVWTAPVAFFIFGVGMLLRNEEGGA